MFVVDKVQNALNDHGKGGLRGSWIHILGVAYKKDIDDVRESPALDIIQLLERRGARLTYSDPYVPQVRSTPRSSVQTRPLLPVPIVLVIVTDHSGFDYKGLLQSALLIVDTRNALKGIGIG